MAQDAKRRSVALRSAFIAGGVSLGILGGAVFRECVHLDRGECSLSSYTLWLSWMGSFAAAWIVVAAATWALERDRQRRQQ